MKMIDFIKTPAETTEYKSSDIQLPTPLQEKIQTYESTTLSQSKEISSLDSLAHVLGSQEHCGRVRGLGLGPCPSKVFGVHARSHIRSSSSTPSNVELQSQVSSLTSSNVKLESQVSSLTSQVNEMKAIMTLLLQNHQGISSREWAKQWM
ncbi:uncharacterized protein LOC128197834 [Vigna angularis]|uniref:uncharacterized protein LOC128197834 n=1 Tax=Phaseolus angularis TaxID=3914 RepID=UPI0022B2E285|nr:uncharacterized protein LOC128197834 [Vigna angularis]